MAVVRILFLLAGCTLYSGCGYIHFGRAPRISASGDAAFAQSYTDLALEHKILKQELALARQEGEALRTALERAQGGGGSDLAQRLNETTRELATLRATHAKRQAQAAGAAPDSRREVEERLAARERDFLQLQEDHARLRAELQQARLDNAGLARQLTTLNTEHERAQQSLSQLNSELLAQTEARHRAEQVVASTRAQLDAVMAAAQAQGAPGGAAGIVDLRMARSPPAGASATAELRTSTARLAEKVAAPRMHFVKPGETLAELAVHYYGSAEHADRIRKANPRLPENGPPIAGTELIIPE